MAITVSLAVSPTAPTSGQTVTATYTVSGNTGTPAGPAQEAVVSGVARIGDEDINVSTTLTLPGTPEVPPLSESFSVPTVAGLTFVATANPKVFTALVP